MRKILFMILLVLAGCGMQAGHENDEHDAMEHQLMRVHAGENQTISLHDYTVAFDHDPLISDMSLHMTFTFKKGEAPLELQPTHASPMHVIVVSKDLSQFYHLHPEEEAPSVLAVHQTFDEPGEYRMWIEFTYNNLQHIVDYDLTVEEGLRG